MSTSKTHTARAATQTHGTHTAPWERENPKSATHHQTLSPKAKAAAKRRAQRAGRPYPNLVDNMQAAMRNKT